MFECENCGAEFYLSEEDVTKYFDIRFCSKKCADEFEAASVNDDTPEIPAEEEGYIEPEDDDEDDDNDDNEEEWEEDELDENDEEDDDDDEDDDDE